MGLTNTYKSVGAKLLSTTGDLLTMASGHYGIVGKITLCNADSSACTINLFLDDGTAYYILSDYSLDVNTAHTLDGPFHLEPGDKITGDASAAAVVSVTIHYLDIDTN